MIVRTLLFALVLSQAAPAAACIVAPPPVETFWPEVPTDIEADEVALEVEYVRPWTEPPLPDADVVIITDCGGGFLLYRVAAVLKGEFKDREILLIATPAMRENGAGVQRLFVVGQTSAPYINTYPPKKRELRETRGPTFSKPIFYSRPPHRLGQFGLATDDFSIGPWLKSFALDE